MSLMRTSDLTPVRIRGRKRKRHVFQPSTSSGDDTQPERAKGTALNQSACLDIPTQFTSPPTPEAAVVTPSRSLSRLELLPAELLLLIFQSALHEYSSIALLETSPYIRNKLDNFSLRGEVALHFFGTFRLCNCDPSWRRERNGLAKTGNSYEYYGMSHGTVRRHITDMPPSHLNHVRKTQSRLLRFRWCTPIFFSDVAYILTTHEKSHTEDLPPWVSRSLRLWLGEDVHIPRKILRWPPNAENKIFLEQLIAAGCTVDWESSLDGEIANESLLCAIKESNWDWMIILMGPGINATPTSDDLIPVIESIDWDPTTVRFILALVDRKADVLEDYRKNLWTRALSHWRDSDSIWRDYLTMDIKGLAKENRIWTKLSAAAGRSKCWNFDPTKLSFLRSAVDT